jgi:calcium-dependent protein kinase
MAPEVINRVPYSYKADMFSVGVISYMLLSGCKPFWASTRKEIAEKVKNCDYSLSNRYWHSISEEAKDFVSKLIEKDPDRRLSAKDAKDHLWLKQNHIDPSNGSHLVHSEHIEKSLIHFADSGEFKKLVLNVLAHQVSAEDIKCLETIFKSYDKDNNGYITNDAFKDALSQLSNLSDESKENMFQSLVSLEMCCGIIAVFISPLPFLNFCSSLSVYRIIIATVTSCTANSLPQLLSLKFKSKRVI